MAAMLSIDNLNVLFRTYAGTVQAVKDVSLSLDKGEVLGIVGESGCGKSVTANAIMGLIARPPAEISGRIIFEGRDINSLTEKELRHIRGNSVSMIFQDPMTSLNPVMTIGDQLTECYLTHRKISRREASLKAVDMLKMVGIPAPETRMHQYPHQLSGGMRQRIMIAMALAMDPQILIADEPTTALDVTIQAQIIELMRKLNRELNTAIILISHDLGVVAGLCSRVVVMYAGQIVESGSAVGIFAKPRHPYTFGLLQSVPRFDRIRQRLESISGQPPDLFSRPVGCAFRPRCQYAMTICSEQEPPLYKVADGHLSRCWLEHEECCQPLPGRDQEEGGQV